jgi:hypothetical protein
MLHADEIDAGQIECVLRRQVVGVKVVGDDRRRDGKQPLQVFDPAREGLESLEVLEIADVM